MNGTPCYCLFLRTISKKYKYNSVTNLFAAKQRGRTKKSFAKLNQIL